MWGWTAQPGGRGGLLPARLDVDLVDRSSADTRHGFRSAGQRGAAEAKRLAEYLPSFLAALREKDYDMTGTSQAYVIDACAHSAFGKRKRFRSPACHPVDSGAAGGGALDESTSIPALSTDVIDRRVDASEARGQYRQMSPPMAGRWIRKRCRVCPPSTGSAVRASRPISFGATARYVWNRGLGSWQDGNANMSKTDPDLVGEIVVRAVRVNVSPTTNPRGGAGIVMAIRRSSKCRARN